jgi:hypothetical protein
MPLCFKNGLIIRLNDLSDLPTFEAPALFKTSERELIMLDVGGSVKLPLNASNLIGGMSILLGFGSGAVSATIVAFAFAMLGIGSPFVGTIAAIAALLGSSIAVTSAGANLSERLGNRIKRRYLITDFPLEIRAKLDQKKIDSFFESFSQQVGRTIRTEIDKKFETIEIANILYNYARTLLERIQIYSTDWIENKSTLGHSKHRTIRIFQVLLGRVSISDLELLCFSLGIDWDEIEGTNKQSRLKNFLIRLETSNELDKLPDAINITRPDLTADVRSILV